MDTNEMVAISAKELDETRREAARHLPWKAEAERMAVELRKANPESRILRGEIWVEFFEQRDKRAPLEPQNGVIAAAVDGLDTSGIEGDPQAGFQS